MGLVKDADRGDSRAICRTSNLFFAAGKADVERPPQHLLIDLERARGLAHAAHEVRRGEIGLSVGPPLRVQRRLQK